MPFPAGSTTDLVGRILQDELAKAVGQTGANVIGGLEIKRNYLDEHTDLFVERLLDQVQPAERV